MQTRFSKWMSLLSFIIYRYISILNTNETFYESPLQTSPKLTVKREINSFSQFLYSIRKTLNK